MIAFLVSLFFAPIAALMAFLITYEEYSRHFVERARVMREALRAAIVTLLIFLALGVGLAAVLPRLVR